MYVLVCLDGRRRCRTPATHTCLATSPSMRKPTSLTCGTSPAMPRGTTITTSNSSSKQRTSTTNMARRCSRDTPQLKSWDPNSSTTTTHSSRMPFPMASPRGISRGWHSRTFTSSRSRSGPGRGSNISKICINSSQPTSSPRVMRRGATSNSVPPSIPVRHPMPTTVTDPPSSPASRW